MYIDDDTFSGTIKDVSFISEFTSKYQKGMTMGVKTHKTDLSMEFNLKMSSVSILLYHTEFKKFLMVRQFRPAVFVGRIRNLPENVNKDLNDIDWSSYDTKIGYSMELCAGLVDKPDKDVVEIAIEEVDEECGYKLGRDQIQLITTFIVGSHQSGNYQHLFYAEINESMKISEGGGLIDHGEVIVKNFMDVEFARKLVSASNSVSTLLGPPGVLLAFQWWFSNIEKRISLKPINETDVWTPTDVEKIEKFTFSPEWNSVKHGCLPRRMTFHLNGRRIVWDLSLTVDSVLGLLVDTDSKELILVQMFRPAVLVGRTRNLSENRGKPLDEIDFTKSDPRWSYTLELCGKQVAPGEDVKAKVIESVRDLGYLVDNNKSVHIAHFMPGIGQSGDSQDIFCIEVGASTKRVTPALAYGHQETRLPFSRLGSIVRQSGLGPPTTYYAIQYVLDKYN